MKHLKIIPLIALGLMFAPSEPSAGARAPILMHRPSTTSAAEFIASTAQDDPTRGGYAGGRDEHGFAEGIAALPTTPGQWFKNRDALDFGIPQSQPRLTLACDERTGEVVIYKACDIGNDEIVRMGLYTPAGNAAGYLRAAAGEELPRTVVRFPADHAIFQKIADAQRFGFGADGQSPLVMAVTEEVRSFLRACRSITRPIGDETGKAGGR